MIQYGTYPKRDKIIELISPYMDKTLSEGCILYMKDGIYTIGIDGDVSLYPDVSDAIEVMGHYDISALINYIKYYIWYVYIIVEEDKLFFPDISISIPNKPLHLYTEEENIELLKNLKTIKNFRNF